MIVGRARAVVACLAVACAPVGPYRRASAFEQLAASDRAGDRAQVTQALEDEAWKVAASAAAALGHARPPEAEARLLVALAARPEWEVRAYTASALAGYRSQAVTQALTERLRTEPRPEVREEVVAALAAQEDLDRVVALVQATADLAPAVSARAGEAVKALAPEGLELAKGLPAAAAIAARRPGDLAAALGFWSGWLAVPGNRERELPAMRAELERVMKLAYARSASQESGARKAAARDAGPSAAALAAEAKALREAARASEAAARADEAARLIEAGNLDAALVRIREVERLGGDATELRRRGAARAWAAQGDTMEFEALARLVTRWNLELVPAAAAAAYRIEQQRRAEAEAERQERELLREAAHCMLGSLSEREFLARSTPGTTDRGVCVELQQARVIRLSSRSAGVFEIGGGRRVHLTFPGPAPVQGGLVRGVEAEVAGTFPYRGPDGTTQAIPRLVIKLRAR